MRHFSVVAMLLVSVCCVAQNEKVVQWQSLIKSGKTDEARKVCRGGCPHRMT